MDALASTSDTPQLLALAAALGWASGMRLYAAVFLTGLAGYLGWIDLPQGLQVLAAPGVLAASGFMCFVEFFADKIPFVDSLWDTVHTVIRIPAGAALAAGAFGADSRRWAGSPRSWAARWPRPATPPRRRRGRRSTPRPSRSPTSACRCSKTAFVVFMLWLSATHPVIFAVALVVIAASWRSCWWCVLIKFLRSGAARAATLPSPAAASAWERHGVKCSRRS